MSDQLKPCPFCGGKATISVKGLDERSAYAEVVTISCEKSCAQVTRRDDDNPKSSYALSGTGMKAGIAIWNTRPSHASIIAQCAAIARDGCLVPPDGGEPTQAEYEMCQEIAQAIEALAPT